MENPVEMDDLGVPLFLETPIWIMCFFLLGRPYTTQLLVHDAGAEIPAYRRTWIIEP